MTTDELIRALRAWAAAFRVQDGKERLANDLTAAADRLEELDERNAILMSNMDMLKSSNKNKITANISKTNLVLKKNVIITESLEKVQI